MPPPLILDPSLADFSRPVYDIEAIRRLNPQRNQMEHLTGIVWVDETLHRVIGYKDITSDDFWVPGHMPGFPLMPGVIMCEAAAQLAAFYARRYKLLEGDFVGFGGMDNVKFRMPVYPPARFVILAVCQEVKSKRRAVFDFQGLVDGRLVVSGTITGVPIFRETPTTPASG